jgi:hypothetical protein
MLHICDSIIIIVCIWSMTDNIAALQDHLLTQLLTKQCLEDVPLVNESRTVNLGQHMHAVKVIFIQILSLNLMLPSFKRFSGHLIRVHNK